MGRIAHSVCLLLLTILLVSCVKAAPEPAVEMSSAGADGIGDSYYPQLGNGGYDALHYTLKLNVDPIHNTLSGECIMEAQATQPLSAFNLDFSGLIIERITVNGKDAKYQREERELTINPAQPLTKGDVFTVTVTYSGTPENSPSVGSLWASGWYHNDKNEVFTSNEVSGSATWYPVNDHPLDKASYSFRITVPKPYVVAANGLLQQELDNGETVTYVWETAEPMASYVVAVDIDDYVIETKQGPDGILIRNYLPPDFPETSKAGIDQTSDMLAFFSDLFGPYPFEAYGIVIVDFPDDGPAAMEAQSLSQHEEDEFLYSLSERIVAHELAHQWFGDCVSLESWQDIWLKEGAATYAEWLWLEHKEGADALDTKVRSIYPFYGFTPDPPGNPSPTNLYTATIYDRGAMVFHALRLRVGDEVFFQILQTYMERFRYGNASTADFIAVAEEVSGQELDGFFEAWLFDVRIPAIPEMGLEP
jgi:aminopeptidase N